MSVTSLSQVLFCNRTKPPLDLNDPDFFAELLEEAMEALSLSEEEFLDMVCEGRDFSRVAVRKWLRGDAPMYSVRTFVIQNLRERMLNN